MMHAWVLHYFLCVLTHTVAWKQSEETLYCYWIKLYKLYLQNFLIQLILRLPLNCVFVTFKTYVSTYLPALITDILWQILSQIIWIFRYREGSFPNFLNSTNVVSFRWSFFFCFFFFLFFFVFLNFESCFRSDLPTSA